MVGPVRNALTTEADHERNSRTAPSAKAGQD